MATVIYGLAFYFSIFAGCFFIGNEYQISICIHSPSAAVAVPVIMCIICILKIKEIIRYVLFFSLRILSFASFSFSFLLSLCYNFSEITQIRKLQTVLTDRIHICFKYPCFNYSTVIVKQVI